MSFCSSKSKAIFTCAKVLLLLVFFSTLSLSGFSQVVVIPRDGFPYCEPFTNSTTRANTIFDGEPKAAFLTADAGIDVEGDGFLQLTDNTTDQRGYVFVDLPFSSAYGIKVSFEYFAYGGINPPAFADGISFFMFDGDIGPSNFQIGGLGGSLGYAPWRRNANMTLIPDQPGLKGGYIGIGFDAFRNWGNEFEGRFGGFKDPSATGFGPVPDERQYYNSIAIRGPESTNYQFIDGKRTFSRSFLNEEQPLVYTDPIPPNYYLFETLSPLEYLARRFKIGSINKAELCSQDGYRKVFIDLAPLGNGDYLVTVDMLVNNGGTLRLENIFQNVPYNFPAPKNLKIGFAASTGTPNTNFHQIRNVTAEVSDYANIPLPEIANLESEVCVGDERLFEFDVEMTSLNSFLRCVQLFDSDPGVPDNTPPAGGDPSLSNCGLSNVCIEKCDPLKSTLTVPGKGTFYVELEQLTTDNFEDEKYAASIRFVPVPGFIGTAQAYYQVLDNYGILSFAKTITVISNPYPVKIQDETIDYPSCDGQSDGLIDDLIVGDLVNGFDYEWFYEGASIGKQGASVTPITNGEATFSLAGINIGTYTLEVWNPSDLGGCRIPIDVIVDQEKGTPVDLELNDQIICEGNDVSFNPIISPIYGDDSGAKFNWYLNPDKSDGPILDGQTRSIDGVNVTFSIASERVLTATGLVSNGASPKDYTFYVEVQNNANPAGNFCPFLGDVESVARVKVYPPIDFTASKLQDDWCLDGSGSIQASVNNPTGQIAYYLLDENGNQIQTNTTGDFTGLNRGIYEVYATSSTPICNSFTSKITIEGPDESLNLLETSKSAEYCDLQNGTLEFTLTGGNTPYSSITIGGQDINTLSFTQTGSDYTVTGLAGQTYAIDVVDDKGCTISIAIDVPFEALSEFAVTSDEICEGQIATVQAQTITLSTSVPTFNWFASDGAGGYTPITTSSNFDGGSFSFDPATNSMSVSGLPASATPYTYYLQVTGSKVCDQGYLPTEILVNFGPEMNDPVLTMVNCFGAANGTIQATIPSGSLSDFQFGLQGDNGVDIPLSANNGLFENLIPGTYSLTIQNAEGCSTLKDGLVITEPTELLVQTTDYTDPTCGESNGVWSFTVSGGTPDASGEYQIALDGNPISSLGADLVVNSPNDFTIANLSPGTHTISVQDSNSCPSELPIDLIAQPIPVFETQDVVICENDAFATLSPVIVDQAGSTPVFSWSYEDPANAGSYISVSSGDVINGATHTIVGDDLQIAGLSNTDSPYIYYLNVTGDLVCPANLIPAQVSVLKLPVVVFEPESTSCFNGNDGKVNLISSDPSVNMTYTLEELGISNATGNFIDLPAGTYTITAQEAGAPCNNQFTVVVDQPTELQLLNENKTDPTCDADNGSFSFDVTGATPPYQVTVNGNPIETYSFSITGENYEVKNLAPGTYSISVVDANGCALDRPDLFTLVNDAGIDVTIDPLAIEVCEGQEAILNPVFQATPPVAPTMKWYKDAALAQPIASSPTPDADGVTYQILGANANLTISGLVQGTYSYYLEISGPGICTSIEKTDVTVYPPIEAVIETTNETCFQSADGTITATPSGGNGNFEFNLNGSAYSVVPTWSNLAPGNYTVGIRNDIGCEVTYDVVIEGPAAPISINTPDIIRSSCDLENGSIENLVISGGWPDYTVEWRKGSPTGTIITGDENGAANLAPDTYYIIVSDSVSCIETFSFVVEESSDPVYQLVPPIDDCTGNQVQIRPIHLAPDPSLPPAAATEVRWYKSAGQVDEITTGPDASLSGVVYTIDDSDWLNPELLIDGLPAGQYTYYFYVVCTGQEIPVDVEVFDTPEVELNTSPEICFGEANGKIVLVSGDLPAYTYQVNSETPGTLAALEARSFAPGTYTISIATPAGCAQTLTVEVEGPTTALALSPLVPIDPGCGASNGKIRTTIVGGWAPYQVELINDGTPFSVQTITGPDLEIDGLSIGTYSLIVTDSEGCQVISEEVTLVDGPTQVLVDDQAICAGESVVFAPTIDPIASPVSYQWFYDKAATLPIPSDNTPDSNGFVFTQNTGGTLEVAGLPAQAAPHLFYVSASGPGICPGFVGEAKVTVYDIPTATFTVKDEICFGDKGEITINATGGSGNYTYSLNGASPVSTNVFDVAPGIYEVEVMTSQSCNVLVQNIEVKGPSAPIEMINMQVDSPTCELDNGQITFEVIGGYGTYTVETFKNSNSIGTQSLPASGIFNISNLGVGEYSFEITDGGGCSILLNNPFELIEVPTVITAPDQAICEGEVASITPSVPGNVPSPVFTWYYDANATQQITSGTNAGIDYQINSSGELAVSGLLSSSSPVTYYVSVEGTGVCGVVPKPVKVIVSAIPNLRVSNPSVVCDPNATVDLTEYIEGFNSSIYDYNVVSPNGTAMQISDLDDVAVSGDYRVSSSLKGTTCWNAPQRIRVLISNSELIANFEYEIDLGGGTIITNGEIQIQEPVEFEDLSIGNAIIWNWDFGDGNTSSDQNPTHSYENKGAYTVKLTTIDDIGCMSEFQMLVNVFDDYNVIIPNAFTPNGQKNQYFKPKFRGIASMDFYIFNTWGELIYHATSLEDLGWDGTLNGKAVPNGNYVYRGTFMTRSGEKLDKAGVFVLIR